MFELTLLALLNSLMNWGTAPVIATRTVAADAPTVHALLSDPASQARLVAGVNPLLRPHVRPGKTSNPRFLHTHVQLGHRNMLWITWLLTPGRGTTEVDLAAQTESRGILARVLLLAGQRQLRRHLEVTLSSIGAATLQAAEDLEHAATTTPPTTPTTRQLPPRQLTTTPTTRCRSPRRSHALKRAARRPSSRAASASTERPTLTSQPSDELNA
jgi:hypothetical protein